MYVCVRSVVYILGVSICPHRMPTENPEDDREYSAASLSLVTETGAGFVGSLQAIPGFLYDFWGLNSGCYACSAGSLT